MLIFSSFIISTEQVDIIISELSLDTLLFLIGALDLAGPYTLRNSPVLANRCQVLSSWFNKIPSLVPGLFILHIARLDDEKSLSQTIFLNPCLFFVFKIYFLCLI